MNTRDGASAPADQQASSAPVSRSPASRESAAKAAAQLAPSQGAFGRRDTLAEFYRRQASRRPVKETAQRSGLSPKTIKHLRAGERGLSDEALTLWCLRDPDFAAAYAAHVGLLRPGEPECAAALTRAINAYVRMERGI